jgi:hypothetical protein
MSGSPAPVKTAAEETRAYLEEHPSIREALRDDIVNFTALARKIQLERSLRNEEAVTIACRRYQRELQQESGSLARVKSVIAESRLQVFSRVALIQFVEDPAVVARILELGRLARESGHPRVFEIFQGESEVTVLCEDGLMNGVLEQIPASHLRRAEGKLSSLAFRGPSELSETPGVLGYLAGALARHGINCLETVSVHSDSILIFRESDVIRAYGALTSLVAPAPFEPKGTPRARRAARPDGGATRGAKRPRAVLRTTPRFPGD